MDIIIYIKGARKYLVILLLLPPHTLPLGGPGWVFSPLLLFKLDGLDESEIDHLEIGHVQGARTCRFIPRAPIEIILVGRIEDGQSMSGVHLPLHQP